MNSPAVIYAACQQLAMSKPTFSTEDIVLASWRASPALFGLRGHLDAYPDSNRVKTLLCGKKSLVHRGHLVKVAANTYRLGEPYYERRKGRRPDAYRAERAEQSDASFLAGLAAKQATGLFSGGHKDRIQFAVAQDFFDGNPEATMRRLREIERRNDEAPGLRVLLCVADWLRERFQKHFALIENRNKVAS